MVLVMYLDEVRFCGLVEVEVVEVVDEGHGS